MPSIKVSVDELTGEKYNHMQHIFVETDTDYDPGLRVRTFDIFAASIKAVFVQDGDIFHGTLENGNHLSAIRATSDTDLSKQEALTNKLVEAENAAKLELGM